MEIKLLHLYYDIMNLYGEYGNLKILERHLIDQGINVTLEKKTIGEDIDFSNYDFIYIGSGTEKNQMLILEDMKKHASEFKAYINNNGFALLTGNSYEIVGQSINDIAALGLLNFKTKILDKRITTDVIYTTSLIHSKVVGFINNMSNIENNEVPLFNVDFGVGENSSSKQEGIRLNNLYGTHVIGPLLVRNPEFLKFIITELCTSKDKNFKYKDLEYPDEYESYKLVLSELEARKEVK